MITSETKRERVARGCTKAHEISCEHKEDWLSCVARTELFVPFAAPLSAARLQTAAGREMVEVGPSWLAEGGSAWLPREEGEERKKEKVAEPGAGPRREAFIKRERTNVAIKTKPTAFVRLPARPASHPRAARQAAATLG
ncbi:hypothetical protein K0M31_010423 [Melipona bicolor]|uniref:Uncharacterized protein n=1 Tax=Melipona bicolor TaxID=60889 RepID=A0AA40FMH8_9HYME|nr:hypothetical protein K0M31_010423 [Melipona bicolor]